MIYLDWAATSLPLKTALDVFYETTQSFTGNPSSLHFLGKDASGLLRQIRQDFSKILKTTPERLTFTAGGTESNNLIILSLLEKKKPGTILFSSGEHASVIEPIKRLKDRGWKAQEISLGKDGRVSKESLTKLLTDDTAMVCCMAISNETGAINPIQELVKATKDFNPQIHFHCDAVQTFGKVPFYPQELQVDSASFSAHKLGAPRGVGLLYQAKPVSPVLLGGGQENGYRPGTENLAGIAAFLSAAKTIISELEEKTTKAELKTKKIIDEILDLGGIIIPKERNIHPELFSPFILSASLPPIPGEVLLRILSDKEICISTGSACSANKLRKKKNSVPGVTNTEAFSAIRISQGMATSMEEIDEFLTIFSKVVKEQKKLLG